MFTEPVGRLTFQLRSFWTQISNGGVLAGRSVLRRRLSIGRPPSWMFWALLFAVIVVGAIYETQTSAFQSRFFSGLVRKLTYSVEPGASNSIVFPQDGPYDLRRGYSRIGKFQARLEAKGFEVKEQARFSPYLAILTRWGIAPPYRELGGGGLQLRSAEGEVLHDAAIPSQQIDNYDEIPASVIRALLLIENRQLSVAPAHPTNNPVVEWNRLGKASLTYAGSKLGFPVRLEGGSTLATQLEKYLHSPAGRTESAADKLRQILSASLKVYRNGADTTIARRRIIVDYLNSMPLAAAPGYGEVNGLGEGLEAWFGADLRHTFQLLDQPGASAEKAIAFKQVLTLLSAVRAPGDYLLADRVALETRARYYANLMAQFGYLDPEFGQAVRDTRVHFVSASVGSGRQTFTPQQKASSALRKNLGELLGVDDFYSLNRLDLEARASIDAQLQRGANELFQNLKSPQFLSTHNLRGERLLANADPDTVLYSLILFERTPEGNVLRVQTDNLDQPLDINEGIKMELGSTAKLRTLAHYLEIVATLWSQGTPAVARDPITEFVLETRRANPRITLDEILEKALDRTYSASPYETFFTGGGIQTFGNFDPDDNGRKLTVREATQHSTNLVFIRLMRDLVRYHEARLPYDPDAVLSDPDNPARRRLLQEMADREAKYFMIRSFRKFQGRSEQELVTQILGSAAKKPRQLTILFFAWRGRSAAASQEALAKWLNSFGENPTEAELQRLLKAYGNPRLTLADYAYLLNRHPFDIWVAGELLRRPNSSWPDIWKGSAEAQRVSSEWLFDPRNRHAQDLRLRIRMEEAAFERMTPYWSRLGFPFERLVPSLATAIGNSSDRPNALAELMGIIVNDGQLKPTLRFQELRFGSNTPYRTVMKPTGEPGKEVMLPAVAKALRGLLAGVVEKGTARRVAGAFRHRDGQPIVVGGKTGSGDNRFKAFSRGGGLISSRAVNRTAVFAFYIGDRYFGVVTAAVLGPKAEHYSFTSALPVEILKNLAPAINARYDEPRL